MPPLPKVVQKVRMPFSRLFTSRGNGEPKCLWLVLYSPRSVPNKSLKGQSWS